MSCYPISVTKLIDRLREIYRSQGMEVTDEALLAGVEALREERFSYRPPRKSLAVRLAYIRSARKVGAARWNRSGWRAADLAGYAFSFSGPAKQRLQEQVAALNSDISATTERNSGAGAGGQPDRVCARRVHRRCACGVPGKSQTPIDRRQNRSAAGRCADRFGQQAESGSQFKRWEFFRTLRQDGSSSSSRLW